MVTQPTAFARAIEEFIVERKSEEDKNSVFYREVFSRINSGSFRRDVPSESKAWANDLSTFVNDLQHDNRTKSKGRRFVERLGCLCAGFDQYASACDLMVQAGPNAAMLLYGGVRILLQLGQKVYECYEMIVDILEDITSHIQCFHSFSQAYKASEHVQKQLVKSYKTIIDFWLKASKLLSGHTLTKIFSRNSQLSRDWQKYGDDLRRCKESVCLAVEAAKADLLLEKSLRDEDEAKEKQRIDTMNSVMDWIKSDESEEKLEFRHIIRRKAALRYGSTCDWIFEHAVFKTWRNSRKNSSLWLTSSPGTGKSVMTAYITQILQKEGQKTVSYLFSFNDATKKRSITALRSLAIQLLRMYQSVPDSVLRIYAPESTDRYPRLEDMEIAVQVVQALLKQISRVHIFIDGLDECQDRFELLRLLPQLLNSPSNGVVKWFLSSRSERDFQDCLSKHGVVNLKVPKEELRKEVQIFMEDGIRDRLGVEYTGDLDHWITESNGNFLWAHLTLQILEGEGSTCEAEIEEALGRFPQGLEGCYERTLRHIVRCRKDAECQLVRRVFNIMVVAVQPLHLSEMAHAVAALSAMESTQVEDDYNPKRVPRHSLIETLCSGLVEFDRSAKDGQDDPIMVFGHKSIRDFFTENTTMLGVSDDILSFFVTEEVAHLSLGNACLHYLSFQRYRQPQDLPTILLTPDHAFLQYAAAFWQIHLNFAPASEELYNRVLDFTNSPGFWNCLAIQSHIVPHMFAQYLQTVRGGYNYSAGGKIPEMALDVAYGSPLPLWLDDMTFGHEGSMMVRRIHQYMKQWHMALNFSPAAFNQCIMDNEWEAQAPDRDGWRASNIAVWTLSEATEIISIRRSESAHGMVAITRHGTNETSLTSWTIDDSNGRSPERCRKNLINIDHALEQSIETVCIDFMNGEKYSLLHRRSLAVENINMNTPEGDQASITSVYSPPHCTGELWHIRGSSNFPYAAGFDENCRAVAIYCSTEVPTAYKRKQLSDSELVDDTESDTSSVSSSTVESETEVESRSDSHGANGCMVVIRPDNLPIWSYWSQQNPLYDTHCAIRSDGKLAVWSTHNSEACVADLTSGIVTRTYLPETVWPSLCMSPTAQLQEFHFSGQDSLLYYLYYTANETDLGIEQRITISALNISLDDGEPLLTRIGRSYTIDYASAGSLRRPLILSAWTMEYVFIALPSLSCDPKFVRLQLSGLSSDNGAVFETLRKQIYFPANAAEKEPKLYVLDLDSEKQNLVLTLNSSNSKQDVRVMDQPPTIMAWQLDRQVDWRRWDEKLDPYSKQYVLAEETESRLRGSFVDPSQRFLVPIRSGLDWTKKAFVACL